MPQAMLLLSGCECAAGEVEPRESGGGYEFRTAYHPSLWRLRMESGLYLRPAGAFRETPVAVNAISDDDGLAVVQLVERA